MNAPLISVLHPTARVTTSPEFPIGYLDSATAFFDACEHPERVQYIVAVHSSRMKAFRESPLFASLKTLAWGELLIVENTGRDCVVDQLNCAAKASTGMLITGTMDDYYPPEKWDTLLIEGMNEQRWPADEAGPGDFKGSAVLVCSSGNPRDEELFIAGAITRARYEQQGFMLDPEFESMFSDNWYTFCAKRDEAEGKTRIIRRMDIQFEHRHPVFGTQQMDAVYAQQNRLEAYKQGELTFLRKATGKKIVLVCLPGEDFKRGWVESTMNMLFSLAGDVLPVPFYGYSSNVYSTRMEMAEAALRFRPRPDFILWKDDDNECTAEQVSQLAQDLKDHPELGVVVGYSWGDNHADKSNQLDEWSLSCGRQRWSDLQCNRFRGPDIINALKGNGLITSDDIAPHVFWSGFPLVLMRMETLELVGAEAFRARTTDPDLLAAVNLCINTIEAWGRGGAPFLDSVRSARDRAEVIAGCKHGQTSEDTSFFMMCHEKGIKCAVDVRVEVPHIKPRAIRPQFIPQSFLKQHEAEIGETALKFGPLNLAGSIEKTQGEVLV